MMPTRLMKSCLTLLVALLVMLPISQVAAAEGTKWMEQVWDDYRAYNKKTVADYNSYQESVDEAYKKFHTESHQNFDKLLTKVHDDQRKWYEYLDTDFETLKKKYGKNKSKSNDLRKYERLINPDSLNSAMWKYNRAGDPDYLNSTMWKYNRALDEDYLNSAMWKFNRDIDPDYLNSSAWKLNNTVDEDYLNSPMWDLRKASDSDSLNSPPWKYKRESLTFQEAKEQYERLHKQFVDEINDDSTKYKDAIAKHSQRIDKEISALHTSTTNALEKQREASLKEISYLRKKISGKGLQWKPLLVTPQKQTNNKPTK